MTTRPDRPIALVGFAESLAAPEASWSLLDAGFAVHAFTRAGQRPPVRWTPGIEVAPITPPGRSVSGAARDLRQLIRRVEPDVVMPLDDEALCLCDMIRDDAGVLAAPGPACVAVALDKRLQIQHARDSGFDVPPTALAEAGDLDAPIEPPAVVRPALAVETEADAFIKRRTHICRSHDEVADAIADGGNYLVQGVIPGVGEGAFGLATPGGVRAWSGHRRVRMMTPRGSGSSACESSPVPDTIRAATQRLLDAIGWRGIFMVELLRDASGRSWFIELNGRAWGSTALARRAGLEYPAWSARLAMTPDFQPQFQEHGTPVFCRHLGRELVHLLFLCRGAGRESAAPHPGLLRSAREIVLGRKGQRFYNWRPGARAVFLADTLQTVWGQLRKGAKG